jgi:FMN phosphatase YigB (HAD superfamily)
MELGQAVEAITLDFGNTLVEFPARSMHDVLAGTAERAADVFHLDAIEFVRVWNEERARQFAEDVPAGREADMDVRAGRVLARMRGCAAPEAAGGWGEVDIAGWSGPQEIDWILDAYASAFVRLTPVPPDIEPMLKRLADRYPLAILSNWPLALAVDRFVEAAGWSVHFSAVVVSQRVGAIKPWPAIFEECARELGIRSGRRILHIGDDLGADVAGAHGVGWHAGWVRFKPEESPLPVAPSTGDEHPDLVLGRVTDLPRALGLPARRTS